MELLKQIPFVFEGQQYEIRLYQEAATFMGRAFLNGKPANGYTHKVELPTAIGFHQQYGNAIDQLIKEAKDDIRDKTWQRFLQAWQKR